MHGEVEDIAVACYVSGRHFGERERGLLKVLVVGELVREQNPYETNDGEHADGWPHHFHSMNVYTEADKRTYALPIIDQKVYQACEHAAIATLRNQGYLEDPDEEILDHYG